MAGCTTPSRSRRRSQPLKARSWELEHQPNMTGTDGAYHPPGSLAAKGERPPATGDYQAWKPE